MRRTAGIALAAVVLLAGCYTGPDSRYFVGLLDDLKSPAAWELVATKIHGPDDGADLHCSPVSDGSCPSAIRYFTANGDPRAILDDANAMLDTAGFKVDHELLSQCDGAPGGPLCSSITKRDTDELRVSIYRSGLDAGLGEDSADRTTVVVTAQR